MIQDMITISPIDGEPYVKEDGPSKTLLAVMEDRSLLATWKNYRVLTSK